MRRERQFKIGIRISFRVGIMVSILLIGLGFYTIRHQKKTAISDAEKRLFEQVVDLTKLVDIQVTENQKLSEVNRELAGQAQQLLELISYFRTVDDIKIADNSRTKK